LGSATVGQRQLGSDPEFFDNKNGYVFSWLRGKVHFRVERLYGVIGTIVELEELSLNIENFVVFSTSSSLESLYGQ
jgi:hypothetical protein